VTFKQLIAIFMTGCCCDCDCPTATGQCCCCTLGGHSSNSLLPNNSSSSSTEGVACCKRCKCYSHLYILLNKTFHSSLHRSHSHSRSSSHFTASSCNTIASQCVRAHTFLLPSGLFPPSSIALCLCICLVLVLISCKSLQSAQW